MSQANGQAPVARERIEKAARMYRTNQDAGLAMGMTPSSFGRLCRRYDIETPMARGQRKKSEAFERRHLKESAA